MSAAGRTAATAGEAPIFALLERMAANHAAARRPLLGDADVATFVNACLRPEIYPQMGFLRRLHGDAAEGEALIHLWNFWTGKRKWAPALKTLTPQPAEVRDRAARFYVRKAAKQELRRWLGAGSADKNLRDRLTKMLRACPEFVEQPGGGQGAATVWAPVEGPDLPTDPALEIPRVAAALTRPAVGRADRQERLLPWRPELRDLLLDAFGLVGRALSFDQILALVVGAFDLFPEQEGSNPDADRTATVAVDGAVHTGQAARPPEQWEPMTGLAADNASLAEAADRLLAIVAGLEAPAPPPTLLDFFTGFSLWHGLPLRDGRGKFGLKEYEAVTGVATSTAFDRKRKLKQGKLAMVAALAGLDSHEQTRLLRLLRERFSACRPEIVAPDPFSLGRAVSAAAHPAGADAAPTDAV